MGELSFPAAVAAAAVILTYLCCVRPMWRGRGCHAPRNSRVAQFDREILQLRAEVARLRDGDQAAARSDKPRP